jgi:putative ABC transport system permease protein
MMRSFWRFLRRESEDEAIAVEMREHQAEIVEELMGGGLNRGEAEAEARRRFGNTAALGENSRDEWGYAFAANLWQDVRYAVRSMARRPLFAAVVILPLALGIGANTAIFTLVHAALVRALPYREPDRLVHLWEINPTKEHGPYEASYQDYQDWRTAQRFFERFGGYVEADATLTEKQRVDRVAIAVANADFFPTLGVQPEMGRLFEPREEEPGSPRVVVLSYGFWQRHYQGDRGILGRALALNSAPFTVVGVLPADFHFASVGDAELWLPMVASKAQRASRFWHWIRVVARLRQGANEEQARAELQSVAERIDREDADHHKGSAILMRPLREQFTADVRPVLLVLGGAIAMVLLLACANVANLLLARSMGRRKELALRGSLGASRGRLVQQLLTENLLLAAAGGVLGVVLARWGIRGLTSALPMDMRNHMPFLTGLDVHWGMLAFTAAVSLGSGVLFGLAPALRLAKTDLHTALESGQRSTGGRGHLRLRHALLVAEVAISLVLLAGAGLMMRSTAHLLEVNPGFAPQRLLTMDMALPFRKYDTGSKATAIHDRILERVAGLPGVSAVGTTSVLPLTNGGNTGTLQVIGRPDDSEKTTVYVRTISAGYLRAIGLPLLAGRTFDERDRPGSPEVILVNRRLAGTVFPNEDAVGKRIHFPWHKAPLEIVGVVGDENTVSLDTELRPVVYFPYTQDSDVAWGMVVRTSGAGAGLGAAIRQAVSTLEPEAPVYHLRTMDQVIADAPSTVMRRYPAMLMGAFAIIALLMAVIGTYGLVAYGVSQRMHEIGVRIALGAGPRDILRLVMGQGLTLTLLGLALGLACAAVVTRGLEKLLFDVKPLDPATFAVAPALLLAAALLASFVPARRAIRVAPGEALGRE